MLPANQSGRGKVRNQVVLSRARKAKGRQSPFFKITTQTSTFTKCDDEPVYTQSPESAAAADPKKAHKGIKTLLSNCVMSAMRYNAHCKDYYERKLKEGKNKFTIFNAMKNKLVRLIFSLQAG